MSATPPSENSPSGHYLLNLLLLSGKTDTGSQHKAHMFITKPKTSAWGWQQLIKPSEIASATLNMNFDNTHAQHTPENPPKNEHNLLGGRNCRKTKKGIAFRKGVSHCLCCRCFFQAPHGYFQSKTSSLPNLSYHPLVPPFISLAEQLSADRELRGQYQKSK